MGRLFKKHPLTIYRVNTPDQGSLLSGERSYDQLQRVSFETIDDCVIEKTFGVVTIENYRSPWFEPGNTEFGEYVAFSIRIDERKLPGAALRRMVEDAIDDEKEKSKLEGRDFVSRDRKREIVEQIKLKMLSRTVPTPSVADVWWNTKSGMLFLTDRSKAMKEALDDLFVGAFGTVYKLEELELGLTAEREMIGKYFLTWLWKKGSQIISYHGANGLAFIDDKVHAADAQEVLKAEKVKGKESDFEDIKRAVAEDGKEIIRALIRIEYQEREYEIETDYNLTPILSLSVPTVTHHDEESFDGAMLSQIGNIEEAFGLFTKLLFNFELEITEDSPLRRAIEEGTKRLDTLQFVHRMDRNVAEVADRLRDTLRKNNATMTIETSDGEKVEVA